jgi:hypothetical protein
LASEATATGEYICLSINTELNFAFTVTYMSFTLCFIVHSYSSIRRRFNGDFPCARQSHDAVFALDLQLTSTGCRDARSPVMNWTLTGHQPVLSLFLSTTSRIPKGAGGGCSPLPP